MEAKKDRDLQDIGANAYASIKELVQAVRDAEDDDEQELAREAILEDALGVSVRSGWYNPYGSHGDKTPAEYQLLLATGGPAVRIIGELNQYCEPETVRLEVQDWGTLWTTYRGAEVDVLFEYVRQFYFGE